MDDKVLQIIIPAMAIVCSISLLLTCLVCRKKRVFLIKSCNQTSTKEVEKCIMDRLKHKMHKKGKKFVARPWDQDIDDGQLPVIVFCVKSSRIGADIDSAMRGVNAESRVILVILHCIIQNTNRGALSDNNELLDPDIKNRMTEIAHFGFSDREGLYASDDNKKGRKQLFESARSLLPQK